MMSKQQTIPQGLCSGGFVVRVPSISCHCKRSAPSVVVRFKENEDRQYYMQQENRSKTETKLSEQQIEEVHSKKEGQFSPRTAEMRADMSDAARDLQTMQTFDGPAPETINGRLAMLGVATGLLGEVFTDKGLLEQTADHPLVVFLSFVLISIATYAPLFRGYTRKEPFANSFLDLAWTPRAENWNGRLAMLGFTGMIITEALSGMNTVQFWSTVFANTMAAFGAPPSNIPGV